ncbi:hypothetical protein PFISCL1PPCAC_28681, partial [Pristionchus fissidentatus]
LCTSDHQYGRSARRLFSFPPQLLRRSVCPALTAHPVETLLYHSINVDPPTQPISSQVHPMPLTVYTGTPIDLSSLLGLTASGAA